VKRLIVTADDLGLSEQINAAIMEAYDHGIVTSTCVLVGASAWEAGIDAAMKRPGLSLGLHLSFVQGKPVCPVHLIPTLAADNGHLPSSAFSLAVQRPPIQELRVEAEAQFERFIQKTGHQPTFVNTHQHTQLLARVLQVMLEMCEKYDVPSIRWPVEQRSLRPNRKLRSWLWPVAKGMALMDKRKLVHAGLRFPDRMLGGPESGRLNETQLNALVNMVGLGTTELVVHPVPNSDELSALTNPEVIQSLSANGVERISFDAM